MMRKTTKGSICIASVSFFILAVAGAVAYLDVGEANASQAQKSVVGTWELIMTRDGDPPNAISGLTKSLLTFYYNGQEVMATALVANAVTSEAGTSVDGSIEVKLDRVVLSNEKLSFGVSDSDENLEVDLNRLNDDVFEGRWKLRLYGRWKSAKEEITGKVKMVRKK